MNATLETTQTSTKEPSEAIGTLEAEFDPTHIDTPDWEPMELEYLRGHISEQASRSMDSNSTATEKQHSKRMQTNHMPHTDEVSSGFPLRSDRKQQPSKPSIQSMDRIPFFGLALTIPFMTLFGETSLFVAGGVFLIAIIKMIFTGFRINPVWGILNVSGFYFPVLWLAFGILNWNRTKREFLFAAVAAACIFYLYQQQGLSL